MRTPARCAFTLVELLVVITIIGVLIALLLPAVQMALETSRRMACCNHVKQIGLALQNYTSVHGVFPPGAILRNDYQVITAGKYSYDSRDPWEEDAASNYSGTHGTSWMLLILPFMEHTALFEQWKFDRNVMNNQAVAATDISTFYCPSRRSGLRPKDMPYMFQHWLHGGNDYAGCIGAQNAFTNPQTSYPLVRKFCGSKFVYNQPPSGITPSGAVYCLRGVFTPNLATALYHISDGLSNTILIGEVWRGQQVQEGDDDEWAPCYTNLDGWAVAGSSTLFDTALPHDPSNPEGLGNNDRGQPGGFNTGYFEAAGSDHPGGAHFGMGDGSVHFINETIDQIVYSYLGSMADGQVAQVP